MREAIADGSWLAEALPVLLARGRKRPAIVRLDAVFLNGERLADGYLVLVGRFSARGDGADVTTEDDSASHTGVEVPLRDHLGGVGDWARRFAAGCGLPSDIARDVELAGRWHDVGKIDRRFQQMLRGGSAFKAEVSPPIAKSALVAADRAARRRAFERSAYPEGARHELASVALMAAVGDPLLDKASDRDLVLHLVASHHGWCRPFAPVAADRAPVDLDLDPGELGLDGGPVKVSSDHALARLDSGIPERFWRLVERYGWFGLAWLEAILRLADHRRSEEEQRGEGAAKEAS
jgi:CRISPR-associated endonuclease/helicase Cas3